MVKDIVQQIWYPAVIWGYPIIAIVSIAMLTWAYNRGHFSSWKRKTGLDVFNTAFLVAVIALVNAVGLSYYLSLHSTLQGLEPLRKVSGSKMAVVFIHGYSSDSQAFSVLEGTLASDNAARHLSLYRFGYAADGNREALNIQQIADNLRLALEAMQETKVIIVAHSMGGVVARLMLSSNADAAIIRKVRAVVSFGTPYNGASIAGLGSALGVNPRLLFDLRPSSSFLTRLNVDWSKYKSLLVGHRLDRLVCVASTDDGVVSVTSATLACDQNVVVSGFGHGEVIEISSVSDIRYLAIRSALKRLDRN